MAEAEAIDPLQTVTVELPNGHSVTASGISEEALRESLGKESPETSGEDGPQPADGNPPPAAPVEKEPKGRARYSKLTADKEAALSEARAAQAVAEELRNRLAILEAAEAKRSSASPPDPVQTPAESFTRPKPVVTEIGTKYADYEAFMEDLAEWKVEQREVKLKQEFDARLESRIEADRASAKQRDASQSVLDRGRAAYPDFDAVVQSCTANFPTETTQVIMGMPNAEHIEYALGANPEWAAKIAAIRNYVELGMELSRVPPAGRVSPASRPAVARTSQAPPPYEPVAGGSSTSAPPLADLADRGDFEAYKARRASELRSAGGVTAHR